MEINIFNVENKDKGIYSGKSFSFDPESILGPNFKLDIENRVEKVNEMIEEIDRYYNINKDPTLKKLIRDMIESRIKFIESYAKFSEWYKKNR
jgi:hypothetical protein